MIVERLFLLTILILPLQFALNVSTSADLVITRVLAPLVFLLWLARGLARKKIWIRNSAESWLLVFFLFLIGVSYWMGLDRALGNRKLVYFLTLVPFYFAATEIARDEKLKKRLFRIITISGIIAALVALFEFSLQFVWGFERVVAVWQKLSSFFLGNNFGGLVSSNPSWLVNISGRTVLRAFGFFPDPHVFSFFVSLCLFAAAGYALFEKQKGWRYLAWFGVVVMSLALLLSFVRGAYLGAIGAGILLAGYQLRRSVNFWRALSIGIAIAVVAGFLFSGQIGSRLKSVLDPQEGSNAERIQNWFQAAEIIKKYPLTGVGLGNYARAVDPLSAERSSIYAHNVFLDIAAETGILNAVVFLLLLCVSFFRNLRSRDSLGLGIAAAILYFFIHGIFDTPLYSPQVFVILLALIGIGAINNAKCKSQNEK